MRNGPEIIIIAAMAENLVIGKDNALPWSIKEDMAHFKELTKGWPCIMGRKTWESLPKRPLPGRRNIIVSRSMKDADVVSPGAAESTEVIICSSLSAAIEHCAAYQKVFICGGASIYREAIPLAHTMELTLIHRSYDGDTFFPSIDSAVWAKTASVDFDKFSWVSYSRIQEKI
ncbi:MAG: dihydrofolate reductase [Treponema sp.]|jgi:dihydrofolate reductase|nr:dihydrofolate reductase [Treponema sp.]